MGIYGIIDKENEILTKRNIINAQKGLANYSAGSII
jgi:hypothetical protein